LDNVSHGGLDSLSVGDCQPQTMLVYNLSFPEFWLRLKIHFSRAVTPSFAKSLFIKCQSRKERGKGGEEKGIKRIKATERLMEKEPILSVC
jgi:hypothetical protein